MGTLYLKKPRSGFDLLCEKNLCTRPYTIENYVKTRTGHVADTLTGSEAYPDCMQETRKRGCVECKWRFKKMIYNFWLFKKMIYNF